MHDNFMDSPGDPTQRISAKSALMLSGPPSQQRISGGHLGKFMDAAISNRISAKEVRTALWSADTAAAPQTLCGSTAKKTRASCSLVRRQSGFEESTLAAHYTTEYQEALAPWCS